MKNTVFLLNVRFVLFAFFFIACAEPGEDGDSGINCGEFGSAHDGHCHCMDGYAFNGIICVALGEITTLCVAHDETVDTDTDTDTDTEQEDHDQTACLCAEANACPCEGTLTEYGTNFFCLPALHDEE